VDIFASPDGLGLQEPRIFIEVKHRSGAMGADEQRSYLGGRRSGERCVYVSTGAFTKEARHEADRAVMPLTLVTLPKLRELLLQHYERLDPATCAGSPSKAVMAG
jgi:restriction system protein